MPRRIIQPASSTRFLANRDRLLRQLVAEFHGSQATQPVILEERIPGTGSRHVHVVWDEWQGVSDTERTTLILEAYRQCEGEAADDVSLALGVTPEEAYALDLLRFGVVPTRRRGDTVPEEQYARALAAELPHTLMGPSARQLRYASLEDAEDAIKRLEQELPGSFWTVVQEVGADFSARWDVHAPQDPQP